jgi:type III pantothenate kinase
MKLLVDIGNSRIKWAEYREGELGALNAMPYPHHPEHQLFQSAWGTLPRPESVILCSVAAAAVNSGLAQWVKSRWGVPLQVLVAQPRCAGVTNGYLEPMKLGVDRWAAIVGAYHLVKQAVCVVDCGTALTVDAVSEEGRHLGGVILPGTTLQRNALLAQTSGIRLVQGDEIEALWGRETTACVDSGILHSQLALIERCMQQLATASGASVQLVLTGGDAERLRHYLPAATRYTPDLVLQGMIYMMKELRG